MEFQYKKRKIFLDPEDFSSRVLSETKALLPTLESSDYYMEPCSTDLANLEAIDPGYCSRVHDFTVGRLGYGCVKFLGETDVRCLNLDEIIKFSRHEVVVYDDENSKPVVGRGLNKAAEVTLVLHLSLSEFDERQVDVIGEKLRQSTKRQGARFVSFDPCNGEWKFLVSHFSRFGLSDDDEEDIVMDDANATAIQQQPEEEMNVVGGDVSDIDETPVETNGSVLFHSLPAHLGLDPIKMKEMQMLMFSGEEEEEDQEAEDFDGILSRQKRSPSIQRMARSMNHRYSPPAVRKTPLALIESNPGNFDSRSSPGTILMTTQQNKALHLKTTKAEGFKLDLKHETPMGGNHSRNVVDAALFMGRSFRVGWGPNGMLVHSGAPVNSNDPQKVLSSIINLEKVATDKVVRDENNKVREELVDSCFDASLNLHKAINHETMEVEVGPFKLTLQKVVSNRLMLSEICRSYIGIVERHLEVPGLSLLARNVLMHQVMVWELIKVLFSEKEFSGQSKSVGADNEEDMMDDTKEVSPEVDLEALPFIRRAEFSFWLQESVCHRVQDEVSFLNESSDLEHIFLLLTGRQLDEAVELAASRGDVRMACLLSQVGGSMVSRSDLAQQLDLWRINGLDFNFIEKERTKLYMLLAGNIHDALHDRKVDWKRFLGLLMWYQLPPNTPLPMVFHTYQQLLGDGRAPYPVPIYIDEGPVEEAVNWSSGQRFDLAYYLMLLHASEESEFSFLKTMFSAFSSTNDPLDYHMIWHQRAILEAVGACSSNDLHVLDMGFVSQLLCLGQCHWAIYVVLHMPHRDDFPYLQATLIREILFQYCESWSSQEKQRQFIEDLGVPSEWLHEALAVYYNYYGDLSKALEHFLECGNWQKAHLIFVTSVAHPLYLSAKHSEIWSLANSMEDHKSEIEHWDLGAGVYISFYLLRSSLQEDDNSMNDLDSLESKNAACREFFRCLNGSLAVWGSRLAVDARVVYSKMAEEIGGLLLSGSGEGSTQEVLLSCYDTMAIAPIPEDLRACHLQDAVTLFTHYLSEIAS